MWTVCLCFAVQLQAQKIRLARTQGPYYGGSLPNVNQIGRGPQDMQVSVFTPPPAGAAAKPPLLERVWSCAGRLPAVAGVGSLYASSRPGGASPQGTSLRAAHQTVPQPPSILSYAPSKHFLVPSNGSGRPIRPSKKSSNCFMLFSHLKGKWQRASSADSAFSLRVSLMVRTKTWKIIMSLTLDSYFFMLFFSSFMLIKHNSTTFHSHLR